jgi:hypothetical protein
LAVPPHERPMLYGMATLDNGGRVCERRIMHALDWRPHQRLDVSLVEDAILMRPAPHGVVCVQLGRWASMPAPILLRRPPR